jgi:hypothetical protein
MQFMFVRVQIDSLLIFYEFIKHRVHKMNVYWGVYIYLHVASPKPHKYILLKFGSGCVR